MEYPYDIDKIGVSSCDGHVFGRPPDWPHHLAVLPVSVPIRDEEGTLVDSSAIPLGFGALYKHSPEPKIYFVAGHHAVLGPGIRFYAWHGTEADAELFHDYGSGWNKNDPRWSRKTVDQSRHLTRWSLMKPLAGILFAVILTGCGSTAPSDNSPDLASTPTKSATPDSRSGPELAKEAFTNLTKEEAVTFTVEPKKGTDQTGVPAGKVTTTADGTYATFTVGSDKVEYIIIGSQKFLRANTSYWLGLKASPKQAAAVADKWTTGDEVVVSFVEPFIPDTLAAAYLKPEGGEYTRKSVDFDGQPAFELENAGDTVIVGVDPALPLSISSVKEGQSKSVILASYTAPTTPIRAPAAIPLQATIRQAS